jgi:putative SOS response-associated peptidase YedK
MRSRHFLANTHYFLRLRDFPGLRWIDQRNTGESVKSLLRLCPAEEMNCYRVREPVNSAKDD